MDLDLLDLGLQNMIGPDPTSFRIGPEANGYVYDRVCFGRDGLWRCRKAAMGWDFPPNWVLYIFRNRSGGMWLASHAPDTTESVEEVLACNARIFGTWDHDVLKPGPHFWNAFVDGMWSGRRCWQFNTTVLIP
jgi:hypothetical protein